MRPEHPTPHPQPALPPTAQQPGPCQAAPAESHPHVLPPQHKQRGAGPSRGGVGTVGLEDTRAPTTWWRGVVAKLPPTQLASGPCSRPLHAPVVGMHGGQHTACCAVLKTACCACWRLDGRVSCKLICHSHRGGGITALARGRHTRRGNGGEEKDLVSAVQAHSRCSSRLELQVAALHAPLLHLPHGGKCWQVPLCSCRLCSFLLLSRHRSGADPTPRPPSPLCSRARPTRTARARC